MQKVGTKLWNSKTHFVLAVSNFERHRPKRGQGRHAPLGQLPREGEKMAASFKWVLQLHRDVPRAARFYSQGLDFTVSVCTLRWAELEAGPLKLALMQASSDHVMEKGYSSLLSFTVADINNTVTKLMALGAELDGPIKYEIHGKVAAMRCLDGHMVGLHEPA